MVKKLTEICVECWLLPPGCKQNQKMFTDFGNTVQYQILVKSVQWLSGCYKQTDGWRNRHTYTRHSERSKPMQYLILSLWWCWGFNSSGKQCFLSLGK